MKTSARPSRRRLVEELPGVHGTARVERNVATLLPRLRPGDVAVVDVLDLDKTTAQALAQAGVAAVIDAGDLISGRYPNLGPGVLEAAGAVLVDRIGTAGLAAIKNGVTVRVHEGEVHVGDRLVASGRVLDAPRIEAEMAAARRGMLSQLQSFTHNSSEFLRREQDLLLHGAGLPALRTAMKGRLVVVVSDPHELAARRRSLKSFLREQDPVLVGVDAGADALVATGLKPDVVVVTASGELPTAKAVRAARDVVLVAEPGAQRDAGERLERSGARPVCLETTASAEDAALLLADAADPRVIVTVGSRASLEEFLDRGRGGQASTYLTRLKVGSRLVDAAAVPVLYSGRIRPRHVLLALVVCVVVVAAAIASTPAGQDWAQDLWTWLGEAFESLRARFR